MKTRLLIWLCVTWIYHSWLILYAQEPPSYDVSVTTITVWVKVVDSKGQPVEGLTQSDFEIYEDKKKVEINCFEEVTQQQMVTAPTPNGQEQEVRQKFAIYLDLFNMTPDELNAIRPRLKDFLARIAVRKPEVMVAVLTPAQKLGIACPFTTDIRKVHAVIDHAPANTKRDIPKVSRREEMGRVMEGAGDDLVDVLRDAYQLADSFAEEDEQRSRFTLAALESFGSHLANLNSGDHIVVLYISGGFSADPGREYFDLVDNLAADSVITEEMHALTFHRRPNFDFQKELQKSIGKLNRLNVTISTLDTQGNESSSVYRDSLVRMADETGGLAFTGSRNFRAGLDRVLDDLQHQYILCYSPPPHEKPGQYHSIKVVGKREGLRLRYRDGYLD